MAATKRNTNTLKRNRELLCPWFDKIVTNTDDVIQCPHLAIKFGLTLGTVVRHFSEFLRDRNYCQPPKQSKIQVMKIKAVFRTPDQMVQTYGSDNKLIKRLCGRETRTLMESIDKRTDSDTKFHGFEGIEPG